MSEHSPGRQPADGVRREPTVQVDAVGAAVERRSGSWSRASGGMSADPVGGDVGRVGGQHVDPAEEAGGSASYRSPRWSAADGDVGPGAPEGRRARRRTRAPRRARPRRLAATGADAAAHLDHDGSSGPRGRHACARGPSSRGARCAAGARRRRGRPPAADPGTPPSRAPSPGARRRPDVRRGLSSRRGRGGRGEQRRLRPRPTRSRRRGAARRRAGSLTQPRRGTRRAAPCRDRGRPTRPRR